MVTTGYQSTKYSRGMLVFFFEFANIRTHIAIYICKRPRLFEWKNEAIH